MVIGRPSNDSAEPDAGDTSRALSWLSQSSVRTSIRGRRAAGAHVGGGPACAAERGGRARTARAGVGRSGGIAVVDALAAGVRRRDAGEPIGARRGRAGDGQAGLTVLSGSARHARERLRVGRPAGLTRGALEGILVARSWRRRRRAAASRDEQQTDHDDSETLLVHAQPGSTSRARLSRGRSTISPLSKNASRAVERSSLARSQSSSGHATTVPRPAGE